MVHHELWRLTTPLIPFRNTKRCSARKRRRSCLARDPRATAKFASRLLDQSRSVTDDPGLQALILEKAYTFGAQSSPGYHTAIDALRQLIELKPDDRGKWSARLVELYSQGLPDRLGRRSPDHRQRAGQRVICVGRCTGQPSSLSAGHRRIPRRDALFQRAHQPDASNDLMESIRDAHRSAEDRRSPECVEGAPALQTRTTRRLVHQVLDGYIAFELNDLSDARTVATSPAGYPAGRHARFGYQGR